MNDADRLAVLRAALGPDLIEQILAAGAGLPRKWRDWPVERAFQYLRCRLKFTQAELGAKAGVAQSQVSLIEGGGDARLSTWRRLFAAMGFELRLIPLSPLPLGEIERRAWEGRPPYTRQRSRPRRRWD